MRKIDADALKASFPKANADIFQNCRNCTCMDNEEIDAIIDSAPIIDGWISVKDRLPEVGGKYLIRDKTDVTVGTLMLIDKKNGIWQWSDSDFYGRGGITHWMPLPEPPEV